MVGPIRQEHIRFFGDALDVSVVGGKAVGLARMQSADMPVPPWFSVTSQAYQDHLTHSDLHRQIGSRLDNLSHADAQAMASASAGIRGLVTGAPMPSGIEQEMRTAYGQLSAMAWLNTVDPGGDMRVAVRSSATAEDLPGASFAGQHDTYLNIGSEDDMVRAVLDCWASLWSPHAMAYRSMQGIPHLEVSMSVVVQKLVHATSAGVVFTANPVTGDTSEVVINAAWGLGEAVVSGIVTPDYIVVSKGDLAVKSVQIADKHVMVTREGAGGTKQVPVSAEQRSAPVLSQGQIRQLSEIAIALEASYGQPQDIEFAIENDKLNLLQCRPITTL
jgi:pyruvate,water dikinase